MLLWDDAGFGGLAKAKKAEVYVYTRDTFNDYPDYYVTDALLKNGRRITEANPQQKGFLWSSGQMLLDYTSAKGDKLQAALFLRPIMRRASATDARLLLREDVAAAQPLCDAVGQRLQQVRLHEQRLRGLVPRHHVQDQRPGMSAVWCVLPAIDAGVATGVVDRSKIGLQGHSWGGYQTAFLITQADFAAAVAGAPLTNLISMYSSIYFNSARPTSPF